MTGRPFLLAAAWIVTACSTAGSTWMEQPNFAPDDDDADPSTIVDPKGPRARRVTLKSVTLTGAVPEEESWGAGPLAAQSSPAWIAMPSPERIKARVRPKVLAGTTLGVFRNTYYFFPSEASFSGPPVPLKGTKCEILKEVPRGFYESICVQGSGLLTTGTTVSFGRRDCECASVCPRTEQRICFDALDSQKFPWGRGASGVAITPLLTVAVDTDVIPLKTAIYIPEYAGLPTDVTRTSLHDGCFIAQDRGLKVKGKHVDVFTGDEAVTELWNALVPSNEGVTVVLDSPRCQRAEP